MWLNFLSKNDWIFSLGALREKFESFWPKKLSHLSWDKNINCIGYPTDNGQSSIIAKAVNKQNTSKLLLYKQYFKMILKLILKSFVFQCDFDFQITTSKMIWILILNHLYYRWFDFDFKIINIWWFCSSLHVVSLKIFLLRSLQYLDRNLRIQTSERWISCSRKGCFWCFHEVRWVIKKVYTLSFVNNT